jgi:hypothetical protein
MKLENLYKKKLNDFEVIPDPSFFVRLQQGLEKTSAAKAVWWKSSAFLGGSSALLVTLVATWLYFGKSEPTTLPTTTHQSPLVQPESSAQMVATGIDTPQIKKEPQEKHSLQMRAPAAPAASVSSLPANLSSVSTTPKSIEMARQPQAAPDTSKHFIPEK